MTLSEQIRRVAISGDRQVMVALMHAFLRKKDGRVFRESRVDRDILYLLGIDKFSLSDAADRYNRYLNTGSGWHEEYATDDYWGLFRVFMLDRRPPQCGPVSGAKMWLKEGAIPGLDVKITAQGLIHLEALGFSLSEHYLPLVGTDVFWADTQPLIEDHDERIWRQGRDFMIAQHMSREVLYS